MKKLALILFFIVTISGIYSQSFDTVNFAFAQDERGEWSQFTNKTIHWGQPIGSLRFPIIINANFLIDTSTSGFMFTGDQYGEIRIVTNRTTMYGFSPGQIRALYTYDANAIALTGSNSWTGLQTFNLTASDSTTANYATATNASFTNATVTRTATLDTTLIGTSLTLSYSTASTLVGLDANKNLVTLATASYPSLTELTYVKGLTSTAQTQLTGKLDKSGGTMTGEFKPTFGASTTTAGAVTINAQVCDIDLEGGINSVTLTNSYITADAVIMITYYDIGASGQRIWVTSRNTGSCVINWINASTEHDHVFVTVFNP